MNSTSRSVILLMNLGSPDSTEVRDVRRYLNEFLMDERVIDMPKLSRTLLVKGLIVPFRAPRSAKAYRSIWTEAGSPLVVLTRELQQAIQARVEPPVEICMRYGNPSTSDVLNKIHQQYDAVEEIILFPLYPHYAMSSYETAVEQVKEIHKKQGYLSTLRVIPPFYNHPAFIQALSESIRPYLQQDYDKILFSYHGIPERHVMKTDPSGTHCMKVADCCNVSNPAHQYCYRHQCFTTTNLVASTLGIPKEKLELTFQSRLGRDPWLLPYTAKRLEELPQEGVKKLLIVCPAFVSDCLETLEEIAVEGKHSFLTSGGTSFQAIPCMNVQPLWIEAMKLLIQTEMNRSAQPA